MKCIDRKTRRSYSFEGHTLEVSEFMGSLNVRKPLLEYLNSFFSNKNECVMSIST